MTRKQFKLCFNFKGRVLNVIQIERKQAWSFSQQNR